MVLSTVIRCAVNAMRAYFQREWNDQIMNSNEIPPAAIPVMRAVLMLLVVAFQSLVMVSEGTVVNMLLGIDCPRSLYVALPTGLYWFGAALFWARGFSLFYSFSDYVFYIGTLEWIASLVSDHSPFFTMGVYMASSWFVLYVTAYTQLMARRIVEEIRRCIGGRVASDQSAVIQEFLDEDDLQNVIDGQLLADDQVGALNMDDEEDIQNVIDRQLLADDRVGALNMDNDDILPHHLDESEMEEIIGAFLRRQVGISSSPHQLEGERGPNFYVGESSNNRERGPNFYVGESSNNRERGPNFYVGESSNNREWGSNFYVGESSHQHLLDGERRPNTHNLVDHTTQGVQESDPPPTINITSHHHREITEQGDNEGITSRDENFGENISGMFMSQISGRISDRNRSIRAILRHRFSGGMPEDCILVVLKEVLLKLSSIHEEGEVHNMVTADRVFYEKTSQGNASIVLGPQIVFHYDVNLYPYSTEDYASPDSVWVWGAAPETAIFAPPTSKSDIWLVGILALELAYGGLWFRNKEHLHRYVFKMNSKRKLPKKKTNLSFGCFSAKVDELHAFSRHFQLVVLRCLDIDPNNRASAHDLLSLDAFTRLTVDVAFFGEMMAEAERIALAEARRMARAGQAGRMVGAETGGPETGGPETGGPEMGDSTEL